MRKIIQISAIPGTEGSNDIVFSLCDDGTVWYLEPFRKDSWMQLPLIPNGPQYIPDAIPQTESPISHPPMEPVEIPGMALTVTRAEGGTK